MHKGEFDSDTAFRHAVEELMDGMLDQLDLLDADALDPTVTPGTLTLRFETGETFILSQQTPTHELWLSANLTAWHFVRTGGTWVERDSGQDMLAVLGGLIGEKLGQRVVLKA